MKIYSVSDLHTELNQLFDQLPVVVEGEIQGAHIAQQRFVWFDLKDETHVVSCFSLVFRTQIPLEDGMHVRVTAKPKLFKKGKFVLDVHRVELVGEGSLKRAFELSKTKLEKEGLFSPERKRSLPKFPQHIGLITSSDAAAYTDVMRILKNRWTGMTIYVYPVQVQGSLAIGAVVGALRAINVDHPDLDCLILTRGGGSMEDLQAFNSEEVCRAIFGSRIPVVCGVGHERDVTLADLVADVRASTPSNAAELTVPDKRDVQYQLSTMSRQLTHGYESQIRNLRERVDHAARIIEDVARHEITTFNNLDRRLQLVLERWVQQVASDIASAEHILKLLKAFHPEQVLKRGYAIVRSKGKVLKSIQDVAADQPLDTWLADGTIRSRVESTHKGN